MTVSQLVERQFCENQTTIRYRTALSTMSCIQLTHAWNKLTNAQKGSLNKKIFSQLPEHSASFVGLDEDEYKLRLLELSEEYQKWINSLKAKQAVHSKLALLYDRVSNLFAL